MKIQFILLAFILIVVAIPSIVHATTVTYTTEVVNLWTEKNDANIGLTSRNDLDISSAADYTHTYVGFNVTGIPITTSTVVSGNITLSARTNGTGTTDVVVYDVYGNFSGWGSFNTVSQLCGNTATPSDSNVCNTTILSTVSAYTGASDIVIDITQGLRNAFARGQTNVSFMITTNTTNGERMFQSKESGVGTPPTVKIEYTATLPPSSNLNITITNPANTTLASSWFLLNFTPFGSNSSYNCSSWIDNSAAIFIGKVNNNTANVTNLTTTFGSHNVTVQCLNLTNTGRSTAFFTLWPYVINSQSWTANPYETNITKLNINISTASNVSSLVVWLNHNVSVYNTTQAGSIPTTYHNTSVQLPLIAANNTYFFFNWSINLTYSNGTSQVLLTPTQNNTVVFAYNIVSANADFTTYSENQIANFSVMLLNYLDNGNYTVNLTYNYTKHSSTLYFSSLPTFNYSAYFNIPNLSSTDTNVTFTYNGSLTVTFNGLSRTMYTQNYTSLVYAIRFTNCSSLTDVAAFNISSFDELSPNINTPVGIKSSVSLNFQAWNPSGASRSFNFTFANATSYLVCIYPANANYLVNATIQYNNDTANTNREYYLVNTNITNVTYPINLFLLDGVRAARAIYTAKYSSGLLFPDAIIKVQRYFNGLYITTAMVKTGSDGQGSTWLEENNVFYKYLMESNGVLLQEFSPEKITADSSGTYTRTLQLTGTASLFYQILSGIFGGCSYNTSSTVLRCTASQTSNYASTFRLVVYQQQASGISWSTLCDSSSSNAATTFTCTLGTTANGTYTYQFGVTLIDGTKYIIEAKPLHFGSPPLQGTDSALIALFIILIFAAFGYWNPVAMMGMGLLGTITSYVLGYLPVSITSMIGFTLVTMIIIYRLKS